LDSYKHKPLSFLAVGIPSIGWLLAFFLAPLAIIFLYSFGENISLVEVKTTWTLDNYARIFQPEIMTLFWRTIWISLLATIVCLIVGFPVALVIATASPKAKPWLLLIIMLPFWTNLLIRTYALLNILGTRGRLNELLEWLWLRANDVLMFVGAGDLALLGAKFTPVKFLGTPTGVVLGIVYVSLPFTILPIYSSLERLDRTYLEASMDLGANQLQTFFRVLVPLAMPGIITAFIITYIPALGQFLVPDLLGRGQVDMIANVIQRQFKSANDWPFGSALSLLLLYITFILLALRAFGDAARSRRESPS